jgi:hypothetical protein
MTERINPYAAPRVQEDPATAVSELSRVTTRRIRTAAACLAVPAAANAVLLPWALARRQFPLFAPLNLLLVGAIFIGLWLFGRPLFDLIALAFYGSFGGSSTRRKWLEAAQAGLWPLPWAAAAAVPLWLGWLYFQFIAAADTAGRLAMICGTLGHLLGATVWLSVFRQWWKLRNSDESAS